MGFWYASNLVPDLLALPRGTVERRLRERGHTRQEAREAIKRDAAAEELVRARAARNAAQGEDETVARSLVWLARAVAGETAEEIAGSTIAATGRKDPHPTPAAVLLSNKEAAKLLGLDYRARRGRPPRRPAF